MKYSLVLACLVSFTISALAQNTIVGTWFNGTKTAKVKIEKSGDEYNGSVVWLAEPLNDEGKAKTDINNPKSSLQSEPIIGLEILKDFVKTEEGKYEKGTIYDPKNGKTYKCKITQIDEKNLDVRGFIGFSLLGRTERWTKP